MKRRILELLYLYHQWRTAVWCAHEAATDFGATLLVQIGQGDKAWLWLVRLKMAHAIASHMGEHHYRRMRHYSAILCPPIPFDAAAFERGFSAAREVR